MSNALLVSSPSKLEMEKIAGWLSKLVHRVQVGPYEREWGIFVPSAALHRARNAFKRVIAANPPGKYAVHAVVSGRGYVRIGRPYRTLTAAAAYADRMVRTGQVVKAVVLGAKGKLRFAAFSGDGVRRVSANKRRGQALRNPMKMLTAEDVRKLPPLYGQEKVEDAIAYVKFFTPWSGWTWYATEFDGKDRFFGLVQGHEEELGYFSLAELLKVRGPAGLRIERDIRFRPTPLSRLRQKATGNPRRRAARPNAGLVQVPLLLERLETVRRVIRHLRAQGIKIKALKQGREYALFVSPRHNAKRVMALIDRVWAGAGIGGAELTTPRQVKKAEAKARRMQMRRGSPVYRPGEYEHEVLAREKQRRGAKRNGTMSTDEAWAALQWVNKNDRRRLAGWLRAAIESLRADGVEEIGSSDINWEAVALILNGTLRLPPGAPWRKKALSNDRKKRRHVCDDNCRSYSCPFRR